MGPAWGARPERPRGRAGQVRGEAATVGSADPRHRAARPAEGPALASRPAAEEVRGAGACGRRSVRPLSAYGRTRWNRA